MDNIYIRLTHEFNAGRLRAVLSSGQAVVLHRLAVMSKDGDWILREEPETLEHVLSVLAAHGARYRLGAPLDVRWMAGGWSSHFEFQDDGLRVRTDFVTRPPRLTPDRLAAMWREQEEQPVPFVGARDLVELKKTNREKDYPVIGELARLMTDPADQLLASRSARDLTDLARRRPDLVTELARQRPALNAIAQGIEALETALDAERRVLMRANEKRLAAYVKASEAWAQAWPRLAKDVRGLPLEQAHRRIVVQAEALLPAGVEEQA